MVHRVKLAKDDLLYIRRHHLKEPNIRKKQQYNTTMRKGLTPH
jgi:hypothetical protein